MTDPTPLNAAELAALKAIHDASTPGEWSTPHLADDTTKCNCVYVLSEGYAGSVCDISVSDDLTISDGGNGAPPLEEAKANARLIPALKNALPRLLKTIEARETQRDSMGEQLEHDRTLVADCLSAAKNAVHSRSWLTEGRGCYEWNDDRWRDEFGFAAQEFLKSLEPMGKVAADWSGCPMSPEGVAKARIDLRAKLEQAETQRDGLLAALKECIGGFYGGQPGYITSLAIQQAKAAIAAAGDHACHPAPGTPDSDLTPPTHPASAGKS